MAGVAMGKTRVVLFTVFTCISLTSQTFHTRNNGDTTYRGGNDYPGGGNDSPPSDNAGLRSVRIDVSTIVHNSVLFKMSNLDPSKHKYRVKIQPLACESPPPNTIWDDISKSTHHIRIKTLPYTNVTLEVQDKTTGTIIGRNSAVTSAKEPEAMVTKLECDTKECRATIDDACRKYNGYNMTVQFILKPLNEELKKSFKKRAGINSEREATLRHLDLLPFTNYTVTAILANNMGVATNSSLTKEAFFTTEPERPGKVSRLEVTHSTPYSLLVEWSPPADDPPKGKLKSYELQWYIHDQTSNKETVEVKHIIENFTITGLESNTPYDIKFDGLTPGKKYTLEVMVCFKKGSCKKVKTLVNWTKPEEPRVTEKTDLQTATATSLTIQLPVLENPPGKLWVLLKRYIGSGDDENIKKKALEETRLEALDKVRRKSEEEKNGKKSNRTQANGRNRLSAYPGQNDDQLRIVAEIEVEEGKEPQNSVDVGSDWNDRKGLDADTDYVVFIVTETRAGPYSEYKSCEPRIMRTRKHHKEPAILGMISGMCVAALFTICLFAMLVVKCKKGIKSRQ